MEENTTNETTAKSKTIYLTLVNGTGYVFNADDYMQLRQNHRIIGSVVGTCSNRGWSANTNTLPAELTKYETQLLVEKGIAVLLSKKDSLLRKPTDEEIKNYHETFEKQIMEQEEAQKTEKLHSTEQNIERIIAGKRRKLMNEGIPESSIHLNREDILKEIGESIVFDKKNALVQIHCEHPWPHEGKIVELELDNSFKYKVFRDLWDRGYILTSGEAFGGDFLLYPGDPLLFHASHIVVILEKPRIAPLEWIAKVRLSVIVNKICIFAYSKETIDNTTGVIQYQTVLWQGNKTKEKKDDEKI